MEKDLKYTNSIFYEIILTGKYMKRMAEQLFRELELALTNEEFFVLDFLYKNNDKVCQRDLAIKMLTDRANMGKILSGLENKGYIERNIDKKQNYPVKLVKLAPSGERVYIDTITKLINIGQEAIDSVSEEESKKTIEILQNMRKVLSKIIDVNI